MLGMNASVRKNSLLLDYLKIIERRLEDKRAVHVFLSRLQDKNKNEQTRQMIGEAFTHMVKNDKGQLFSVPNGDIIMVFIDKFMDEVDAALVKIRFMFSDDPFIAKHDDARDPSFATWYDLKTEFQDIMTLANRLASMEFEEDKVVGGLENKTFVSKPIPSPQMNMHKPKGAPLTVGMLAKVEKALTNADFANMIRRQSICAVVGDAMPQIMFDEVFVAIGDLRETLLPDVDLVSCPWLFQRMTETLDKRVLANINRHDDGSLISDFSINLNVGTVLSDDFLKFDYNINDSKRSTIVLEMQMVDIFSDLSSFFLARDFAHERGYKICIDGITQQTIKYIDRLELQADYVKLFWNQNFERESLQAEIQENIKRIGASRTILCRVDDSIAVDLGHKWGVNLFQGRYIQKVLFSDPRRRRVGTVLVRK